MQDGGSPDSRGRCLESGHPVQRDLGCKSLSLRHGRVAQRPERALYKRKGEGENPSAATTFLELKPQQTGTGLLIRQGEVATTSSSTIAGSSNQ